LQREFDIATFVETGLGQGTSALWAERNFYTCISIEIDSVLVRSFHILHPTSEVKTQIGDSGALLDIIMEDVLSPVLFWLDGHTDDYCPVMAELGAINASPFRNIILIDDARLFGTMPAWPTREQVYSALEAGGRRVVFDVDDVLVAVPLVMAGRVGRIIEKH
jgi:hypothetical protein